LVICLLRLFISGLDGLKRLLFFRVEDAAIEVPVCEGEVGAVVGCQQDAEFACKEFGGVIGTQFAHEDVLRKEWAACLDRDEWKDGGDREGQEREGPFHG